MDKGTECLESLKTFYTICIYRKSSNFLDTLYIHKCLIQYFEFYRFYVIVFVQMKFKNVNNVLKLKITVLSQSIYCFNNNKIRCYETI